MMESFPLIIFGLVDIALLLEIVRRVSRLETKVGLCKHCPITNEPTREQTKKKTRNTRGGEIVDV